MQAPADGLDDLVAHSVRELESMSRDEIKNNQSEQDLELERSAKVPRTEEGAVRSGLRHVQTEQRRRDRINEGFAALKALMPSQERMDKATFLGSTVEYIKQLQGIMQQLVSSGAVSKLPEEAQWNIRVLLPRKAEPSVAPFTVPAACVANPAMPVVDPVATNAALLSILLNQPNQMAATSQQGQSGLDIAQLVQQAAYSQQLQAQQSQLLQALQMQHLFQAANASAGMPVDNLGASATAALPNMGQFLPSNSTPQAIPVLPMTVGCIQDPPASVMPKARKNGKVRRHTTAARIPKPAADMDAPAMDVGRPAPSEVAI